MSEPAEQPLVIEVPEAEREELMRLLSNVDIRQPLTQWIHDFEVYGEAFCRLEPVTVLPPLSPGAIRIVNNWGSGGWGQLAMSAMRENGVAPADAWPARRPPLSIESPPLVIEPLPPSALPNTRDGWEEMMRVMMDGMALPAGVFTGTATTGGITRNSVMDAMRLMPNLNANELERSRALVSQSEHQDLIDQWDREMVAELNAQIAAEQREYSLLLGFPVTDQVWQHLLSTRSALQALMGPYGAQVTKAQVVEYVNAYCKRMNELTPESALAALPSEPHQFGRVWQNSWPNDWGQEGPELVPPLIYGALTQMTELTQDEVRAWTGSPVNELNPEEGLVLQAGAGQPRVPPQLFPGVAKLVWDSDKLMERQRDPHLRSELVGSIVFMLRQVMEARNMVFDNYKFTLNAGTPITNGCRVFAMNVLQPTRSGVRRVMTCRLLQRVTAQGAAEWGVQVTDEPEGHFTRRPRSYVGSDERRRLAVAERQGRIGATVAPRVPPVSAPPPTVPRPEQRPGIDL